MPGKNILPIAIIIILLIGLGFTSTAAFAYWQDISRIGNVVIEYEGEDANLVVEEMHEVFSGKLVPEGYVYFEGEVDSVTFEYEVSIDKTLVRSMNLVVESFDVNIGEDDNYAHLVDITIGPAKDSFTYELFNSKINVIVVVRLLEPIDEAKAIERGLDLSLVNVEDSRQAYDDIKGQTITFSVRFRVEPREVE